jgi:NAD(P)H-hydrate epimerase
MTPILTAAEMRRADKNAIEQLGIPSLVLMENAARGACDLLIHQLGSLKGKRVAIVCGKGNNGGDGIALARHALIHGAEVTCALLASEDELSADAKAQHIMLAALAPATLLTWQQLHKLPSHFDAVVDAVLGTGAGGELRGVYADAVRWMNEQPGVKLALDVPTGIDSDSGTARGEAFHADVTATMAALKPGLLLNEGSESSGKIAVVHIGVAPSFYEIVKLALLDEDEASKRLPALKQRGNKYDRGKVLVVAGSRGMSGAGMMASEAALRSGSGLVVYAMPEAAAEILPQRIAPEIMTLFLPSNQDGAFAGGAFDSLRDQLDSFSVVAVGPGVSKSEDAATFVRELVQSAVQPLVLDADGLNAFRGRSKELSDRQCELVITPHHGEMARLLDIDKHEIAADPVAIARSAAERLKAVVVLKGAPTVVALADGRAWINSAGNPGMATGGTGDVLTGMIASLTGQCRSVEDGTLAAVFLHSLAGDLAARVLIERSLIATDIIEQIPQAYRTLLHDTNFTH